MILYEYNNNRNSKENSNKRHMWFDMLEYTLILLTTLTIFFITKSSIDTLKFATGIVFIFYPLIKLTILPRINEWWEKYYQSKYRLVAIKSQYGNNYKK